MAVGCQRQRWLQIFIEFFFWILDKEKIKRSHDDDDDDEDVGLQYENGKRDRNAEA